jgi:N-acetylmuramoyl-L-alanine amidase
VAFNLHLISQMNGRFTQALRVLLALAIACCFVAATKKKSSKKKPSSTKSATPAAAKASSTPSPSAAAKPTPTPAGDWKIVKVGLRDYLSLDNVAKFYGLPTGVAPEPVAQGKRLHLLNEKGEIIAWLDNREIAINGVRNWLCFPIVSGPNGEFLVSRVDLAKTIEPQMRPQMIGNLGKFQTVVLDPGHGAWDKGATSPYGAEKDYTLDVAKQLKPMLEAKGLKVVMTRDSDVFIPLEERARIANNTPNCIFVSIHFNATDMNPAATGFEIYSLTPRGAPSTQDDALALHFLNMQAGSPVDAPSLALSMSVYHSVLGHLPEFDRGIKRARFAVLRLTRVPAILVEGGFLTERGESRLIATPEWRGKLAQAISIGVENYKALVDKRQKPTLLADYRRQNGGSEVAARDLTQPPKDLATPPSSLHASINPTAMGTPSAQTTQPVLGQPEAGEASPPPAAAAQPTPSPTPVAAPSLMPSSTPAVMPAPSESPTPFVEP